MTLEEMLLVFAILFIFSLVSYYKKLLDLEGIILGNVVGLAAISFAPHASYAFFAVLVFFILGELASNYPKRKHEQRNIWNVIGNALPALAAIGLVAFIPSQAFILEIAFFAAIAGALADTLSSEVGYYSKKQPILITTFKKVERGVDGGITLLGEAAALIGGLAIACIHYLAYNDPRILAIILIAAMVGTNSDSLAGALFQRRGLLDNTQVNIIGSSMAAISAYVLALIFL